MPRRLDQDTRDYPSLRSAAAAAALLLLSPLVVPILGTKSARTNGVTGLPALQADPVRRSASAPAQES